MDEGRQIATNFRKIFEHEWVQARDSLREFKHDEEILYLLMRIVRSAYNFCSDTANGNRHQELSTEKITEEFMRHHLTNSLQDHLTSQLSTYIHKCIDCIMKMCSIKHQLTISWIPKGDAIDTERFQLDGDKTGNVCDWTIWPAVLAADETVLSKGVIIPIE